MPRVIPTMTPSGVEHKREVFRRYGVPLVIPTMTPSGVEHFYEAMADHVEARDPDHDALGR